MRVRVFFTPRELPGAELTERVVVIDVLRATTTIVEALRNGARAIFPVATADDAAHLAQTIGRDSVLLSGERKGVAIEGFDLGNAPSDFTRETVAGKSLVMTTTNGTGALLAVAERRGPEAGPSAILVGSFLNRAAVAAAIEGEAVALVCAGREGQFALEDALCAGSLIRELESRGADPALDDAGAAARRLAAESDPLVEAFRRTAAGRRLVELGRDEDLAFCAQVDRSDGVPSLRDRKITLE